MPIAMSRTEANRRALMRIVQGTRPDKARWTDADVRPQTVLSPVRFPVRLPDGTYVSSDSAAAGEQNLVDIDRSWMSLWFYGGTTIGLGLLGWYLWKSYKAR